MNLISFVPRLTGLPSTHPAPKFTVISSMSSPNTNSLPIYTFNMNSFMPNGTFPHLNGNSVSGVLHLPLQRVSTRSKTLRICCFQAWVGYRDGVGQISKGWIRSRGSLFTVPSGNWVRVRLGGKILWRTGMIKLSGWSGLWVVWLSFLIYVYIEVSFQCRAHPVSKLFQHFSPGWNMCIITSEVRRGYLLRSRVTRWMS